jgi:uncharacterized membrane protein YesL
MGRIFDLDSPIMKGLSKMADVMWLNILVMVFALPLIIQQYLMLGAGVYDEQGMMLNYVFWAWIVGIITSIPLGAALTAMHFVLLKIVRDEESYITKTFFKSYKENFKQSTVLMIIQFVAAGILVMDFLLMRNANVVFRYIITAATIILLMAAMYIFPLQSKFQNSILGTLKNSFLVAIMALPRTIAMVIVSIFPVLLYYFFGLKIMPLLILLGVAGPGYACAALYSQTFKQFEPKEEDISEEQELENAIKKIDDEDYD